MSWFTRNKNEEEPEQRNLSIGDPAVALLLGYTDGITPPVSEHSAITLSAVYRAVSLISGTIASLPLRTIEEADGFKQRTTSFLDRPRRLSQFEWTELVVVSLVLHGNAFLQHMYDGAGRVVDLWPVHPSCVTVERTPDGRKLFKVQSDNGVLVFDETRMTHIMGMSFDGIRGVSPLTIARQSIGTGLAGDKAAAKMFQNGPMIAGMVTPDEDVSSEEAMQIQASLSSRMTGTDNAGDIVVINRKLKFSPWTVSAEDAQFLQSRVFQVEEVARWFGVPPHLLAQTDKQTSWGTGVAEQNRGLARYTLQPWTRRIEAKLTPLLPSGKSAEFDYSQFIAPSPETEIDLLIRQVGAGLLTVDEARKIRNLPPLEVNDAQAGNEG